MEEILELIIEYVSIWAPSLVSILAIVVTVLKAITDTKTAINELKADTTFNDLKQSFIKLSNENEELVPCNKLLLDQITKIKNYADNKKKED